MQGRNPTKGGRLSIGALGASFVLFGLSLAALLASLAFARLDALLAQAQQRQLQAARGELEFTLGQVVDKAHELATRLAEWDEVRRQFADPGHYAQWRIRRVLAAKFVPPFLDNVELYDRSGAPLAGQSVRRIPAQVVENRDRVLLLRQAGHDHLYHVEAVRNDDGSGEVLGYVALELDFTEALEAQQKFRYVDVASLRVNAPFDSMLPADSLVPLLEFSLLDNPELTHLRVLMQETLGQFGLLAVALGLVLFFCLVTVVGLPLRRLSQYIDALGGGVPATALLAFGPLRVAELEKVRWSLDDFQEQLRRQARALERSEARLRALLENVPDGVVILDQDGRVRSLNPAAERLFGGAPAQFLGAPAQRLFSTAAGEPCPDLPALAPPGSRRPLELVARRVDGAQVHVDVTCNRVRIDEEELFIAVLHDISSRKQTEERLRYLANYDALTGLPNRALFRDRLEQAVARAQRGGQAVALLFIDLDQFKRINDTLGHQVGDALLVEVARRLGACVRETDTAARLGGDEFTMILEAIAHADDAARAARAVIDALCAPFRLEGHEFVVTPSIGITTYPADGEDIESLLKNADTAMYRAKELGGNAFQFFTAALNQRLTQRLGLESRLRRAVENGEFLLHYQPQVDAHTREVVGVEALLRWHSPDHGLVPPTEFIPLLEEMGLIVPVGEWVLHEACAQARRWDEEGLPRIRVAVNLSARQFRQNDLVRTVAEVLAATGLPAQRLELEITEGLLIDNIEEASATLGHLERMQVHIAVDDFGTGYSSLSYLKRFPIGTLKIDQSFVRNVNADPDNAAIVSLIIDMARSLGMSTTAEGVESEAEREFLRRHGCRGIQGFLIGRPMDAAHLGQWLGVQAACGGWRVAGEGQR